jgi:hypothetical protein
MLLNGYGASWRRLQMLRIPNLTVRRGTTVLSPWELLTRMGSLLDLPRDPLLSALPPLVPCPI